MHILFFLTNSFSRVHAQVSSSDSSFHIDSLLNEVFRKLAEKLNIPGFNGDVSDIFTWAIGLGGLIALAVMIWAGFLYITSATNPSKAQESKEWMKAAIWGLLLLFGGWMILYTINPNIVGR